MHLYKAQSTVVVCAQHSVDSMPMQIVGATHQAERFASRQTVTTNWLDCARLTRYLQKSGISISWLKSPLHGAFGFILDTVLTT